METELKDSRHSCVSSNRQKPAAKSGNRYSIDMILGKLLTESSKKDSNCIADEKINETLTVFEDEDDDVKVDDDVERTETDSDVLLGINDRLHNTGELLVLQIKHAII